MRKTFLITGATKGIGLATAQRLAAHDYTIIGIARNNLDSFPGTLFLADLADKLVTEQVFHEINEQFTIDGIVNNVGGEVIPARIEQIDLASFNNVLELNLRPALQATQIFIKKMRANQWGRIINISSRALLGLYDRSVYSAAKAGLVAFTRSWALELAQTGITVNAVAPGPIETERYREHRPKGSAAEQESLKNVPMGRVGKPAEVAAAIEFLLSEDAGFITGQTLFIDGGASIGRSLI